MAESSGGISRRRVVIGAAWMAPVILLATAVPARAGSMSLPVLTVSDNTFQVNDQGDLVVQVQVQWQGVEPDAYLTPAINDLDLHVSIPNSADPGTPDLGTFDGTWQQIGSGAPDPEREDYTMYVFRLLTSLSNSFPSATFGVTVPLGGTGTGTGYAWATGQTSVGPVESNLLTGTITIPE